MDQSQVFRLAITLACTILLPGAAAADTIYDITADTSSISGEGGYIDLQLEPGPAITNLATAVVTDFETVGTLIGTASLTGDVTGQLPGTLNFDNETVFNDYFQMIKFGTEESFTVTLNGPTPGGGGPSAFNIAFYASDGSTPLLTVSPDGIAGEIVINPDGSTTATTYAAGAGVGSVLSVAVASPEPKDVGWAGVWVAAALILIRKWRQKSGKQSESQL
jgi:hypothetical protein